MLQIKMDVTSITVLLVVTFLSWWSYKRWRKMSVLKDLGIPGPKPNFFVGNLLEISRKGIGNSIAEWHKQYGKCFGYYLGGSPIVVILDTDILKQIEIKDFHSFINRPKLIPGGSTGDDKYAKHVLAEEDDRWKEQRAILTPTFTSGKMKQMFPHFKSALNIFLEKVEKTSAERVEFDLYEMFKGLTLDVIARTAFGTETNVQLNPKDPFLEGLQDFLKENPFSGLVFLATCFPDCPIIPVVRKGISRLENFFWHSKTKQAVLNCLDIVKGRRSDPKNKRNDLLQLMLDAEISRSDIKNASGENLTAGYESEVSEPNKIENDGVPTTNKKSKYYMSDREVVSNTVLFLIAGYETTSTTLGYMSHALITNPEVQEKVREEVRKVVADDGELNYSSIAKLKYLDQVMSETLRFYNLVPVVARAVSKEEIYGKLRITKELTVQVPISLLHSDPELWNKPEIFNPERFSPENKKNIVPMSYQPFGAGPRNCIGMRFAQLEAKLAMASLLLQYRLVPSKKSEMEKLTVVSKLGVIQPKKGVWLMAEKI